MSMTAVRLTKSMLERHTKTMKFHATFRDVVIKFLIYLNINKG